MSDRDSLLRVVGAYLAWDAHLSGHYCKAATGEGLCGAGEEILRRLHTAAYALDAEERRDALGAVREWDWQPEALYPAEDE